MSFAHAVRVVTQLVASPTVRRTQHTHMSSTSSASLRFAGYAGRPDRAGLGPTGVFLDHLLASKTSAPPSVICVQESVKEHTDELVAVLNAAIRSRGGKETYAVLHGTSSGPEGIATVYDAARLGDGDASDGGVVDCTRNAAGGMMGCVGRAFQAVYFRQASLLVISCHAPNAAVPREREAFRGASDGRLSAPRAIQEWLANTDGWIDFGVVAACAGGAAAWEGAEKPVEKPPPITTVVLAGDFNDAADVYEADAETLANTRDRGVVVPVSPLADGEKVTVRLPGAGDLPTTCCAYALDKPTRLPGDYVLAGRLDNASSVAGRALRTVGPSAFGEPSREFTRDMIAEEQRAAFNPQGGEDGVEANRPYFPSWKKVTDGLQVNEGEALNDAIWRHLRRVKGVGTGFAGEELYSDHLAVTTEVDLDSSPASSTPGEGARGSIGVCSLNISFQISDPNMWDKSFPSEVAATVVLNRLHAEATSVARGATEN